MVKVIHDDWVCARADCGHRMDAHYLRHERCMLCGNNAICNYFYFNQEQQEIMKKEKKQYERRNSFIGRILNKLNV